MTGIHFALSSSSALLLRFSRSVGGWFAVILFVLAMPQQVFCEVFASSTAAYSILGTGVGARGSALGDSYVALVEDASALFWNPGALGCLQRPMIQTDYRHFPLGGQEQVLAGVLPVHHSGVLGCDITYRDLGTQDGYDAQGVSTQSFHPNDFAFGFGWGIPLSPRVSVGFRTLWFRQNAPDYHETGLVENVGVLVIPCNNVRLGAALKNMGLDTNGFSLPVEMNIGLSRVSQWGEGAEHSLGTAVGLDFRAHDLSRFNMGLEYSYRSAFFLRMGWAPRWGENELNTLQSFTTGVGFSKNGWALDYALTSQAELGWEHRISITWMPPWSKDSARDGMNKNQKREESATPLSNLNVLGSGENVASNTSRGTAKRMDSTRLSQKEGGVSTGKTTTGMDLPPIQESVMTQSSAVTSTSPEQSKDAVVLKFQLVEEDDSNWTPLQLCQRAEKALSEGKADEALSYYQKCVARNPLFEKAWIRISQIQYQKAMEAAQKALKADPQNESLKRWLERH
jgi:hypothetical protein